MHGNIQFEDFLFHKDANLADASHATKKIRSRDIVVSIFQESESMG